MLSAMLSLVVVVGSMGLAAVIYGALHRVGGWLPLFGGRLPMPEARPAAELLPIEGIAADGLVRCEDGALLAMWEIDGVERTLSGDVEIMSRFAMLGTALNTLSLNTEAILQVVVTDDVGQWIDRHTAAVNPQTPEREYLARVWRGQLAAQAKRGAAGGFSDTRILLSLRVRPTISRPSVPALIAKWLAAPFLARTPTDLTDQLGTSWAARRALFDDETRPHLAVLQAGKFRPRRLDRAGVMRAIAQNLWSSERLRTEYAPAQPERGHAALTSLTPEVRNAALARYPGLAVYHPPSIRSHLARVTVDPAPDHLLIDGTTYVAMLRMTVAPRMVDPTLFADIRQQFQGCGAITTRLRPLARQAVIDRVRKEAERKRVMANSAGSIGGKRDKGNVRAAEEAEAREAQWNSTDESPYDVQVMVRIEAPSLAALQERCEAMTTYFATREGAQLERERFEAEATWRAAMPVSPPRLKADGLQLATGEAIAMIPVFGVWRGSDTPVRVFQTSSGEPFGFDPLDPTLEDRNAFVVGKTGSGKGVTGMSAMIHPALLRGNANVRVIDADRGYYISAMVNGGVFFEYSERSPYRANIFCLPAGFFDYPDAVRNDLWRMAENAAVMSTLALANPAPEVESTWTSLIAEGVTTVLQASMADRRERHLRDVYQWLVAYQNAEVPSLVQAARMCASSLRRFVHDPATGRPLGAFAALFDADQHMPVADYVVVDFNPIKEGEKSILEAALIGYVQGYLLPDIYINKLTTGKWTFVLGDEFGDYCVALPRLRNVFLSFYRKARKEGSGVAAMLQGWSNLFEAKMGDFGDSMAQNATTRFFTFHKHSKALHETLHNAGLGALYTVVTSLSGRDGVSKQVCVQQSTSDGDRYTVIEVANAPYEKWLTTTNPVDRKLRAVYLARYGRRSRWGMSSFEREVLLSEIYPNGATAPAAVAVDADGCAADEHVEHILRLTRSVYADCVDTLRRRGVEWTPTPEDEDDLPPAVEAAPVPALPNTPRRRMAVPAHT